MPVVSMQQAETDLARLIALVEAGYVVVIARDGKPVARMMPTYPQRRFGALAGVLTVDDSAFDPLPEDEIARWE